MRKQNILFSLCIVSSLLRSQTVTPMVYSNQGGYNVAAGGSISWTIGEPISETYTTTTKITTMGFHQPELGIATLINEQGQDKNILVYPNPVSEVLSVSFKDLESNTYQLELLDATGKLVYVVDVKITEHTSPIHMNMSKYAAGNYYLRITNPSFIKTVKLNKTH